MDQVYRIPASRAFQVALSANEPLSVMNYWWIDIEEHDPDFAFNMPFHPLLPQELRDREPIITKRLNGRLKGLLEIHQSSSPSTKDLPRVDFLHRTVKDFLITEGMQRLLLHWSPPGFNPHELICKTLLAELKSDRRWREDPNAAEGLVGNFLYSAKKVEMTTNCSTYPLISKLDAVLASIGWYKHTWMVSTIWFLVIQYNIRLALDEWLPKDGMTLPDGFKSNLFIYALSDSITPGGQIAPEPATIKLLLSRIMPVFIPDSDLTRKFGLKSDLWRKDPQAGLDTLQVLSDYGFNLEHLRESLTPESKSHLCPEVHERFKDILEQNVPLRKSVSLAQPNGIITPFESAIVSSRSLRPSALAGERPIAPTKGKSRGKKFFDRQIGPSNRRIPSPDPPHDRSTDDLRQQNFTTSPDLDGGCGRPKGKQLARLLRWLSKVFGGRKGKMAAAG